jgi:hypothetical protein
VGEQVDFLDDAGAREHGLNDHTGAAVAAKWAMRSCRHGLDKSTILTGRSNGSPGLGARRPAMRKSCTRALTNEMASRLRMLARYRDDRRPVKGMALRRGARNIFFRIVFLKNNFGAWVIVCCANKNLACPAHRDLCFQHVVANIRKPDSAARRSPRDWG